MDTTLEVKDRVDSPRGWSLLGAIVGAGVSALFMKKALSVRRPVESQALMLALGSFALGVFATLLLPVSARERRRVEPGGLGVRAESMAGSNLGSTRSEDLMGAERPGLEGSDRAESLATPTGSRIPPMPPLDDTSTKIH